MARNIQIPPRGPSKSPSRSPESGSETSSEGDAQKSPGIPQRTAPLRPARRAGINAREETDKSEGVEGTSAKSTARASRQGLPPTGRIPRIAFRLKKTAGLFDGAGPAQSAEEMLLEYVSPQMQEPILQPGLALRLLATLLSKVLPELKGNPNILSPASTVMDDEKRRFSDLRARFNEQGLAA